MAFSDGDHRYCVVLQVRLERANGAACNLRAMLRDREPNSNFLTPCGHIARHIGAMQQLCACARRLKRVGYYYEDSRRGRAHTGGGGERGAHPVSPSRPFHGRVGSFFVMLEDCLNEVAVVVGAHRFLMDLLDNPIQHPRLAAPSNQRQCFAPS